MVTKKITRKLVRRFVLWMLAINLTTVGNVYGQLKIDWEKMLKAPYCISLEDNFFTVSDSQAIVLSPEGINQLKSLRLFLVKNDQYVIEISKQMGKSSFLNQINKKELILIKHFLKDGTLSDRMAFTSHSYGENDPPYQKIYFSMFYKKDK